MSEFSKLSRIACAIFDIILSIGLSIHYINKGKPEIVPLFIVIAIGMVMWIFGFVKSKDNDTHPRAFDGKVYKFNPEYDSEYLNNYWS